MTPREVVDQLTLLCTTGRDEEALALSERMGPVMTEKLARELSREEFWAVLAMMEGAQLAVDLLEAADEQQRPTSVGHAVARE